MSEREPLLSDDTILNSTPFRGAERQCAWHWGAEWGRAYYERLIDEGKLRMVEEVEAIERWSFIKCSGCGLSYPWEADALIETINYCPGCGNKVKQ